MMSCRNDLSWRELNNADPDVVARQIGLTGKGGRYWCPFCQNDGRKHETPDLSHPPRIGAWKCFRCGWTGTNSKLVRECAHTTVAIALEKNDRPRRGRRVFATLEDAINSCSLVSSGWTVTGVWRYTPTYATVRFDRAGQKQFRQYRKSATSGGWVSGAPPPPRPLYVVIPQVILVRGLLVVVEGEKCCDRAARALRVPAVTSPGGANGANMADWRSLLRKNLGVAAALIVPDNDAAGSTYATAVATLIVNAGVVEPGMVKIATPDGLGSGEDIYDYCERYGDGAAYCWMLEQIKTWLK